MGKPDSEISDLEKKRRMRNSRKKRKRQQRAINKRNACEEAIAKKINDNVMEQKALAEKYYAKCRKICKEANDLRRKIPTQSHLRKVKLYDKDKQIYICISV